VPDCREPGKAKASALAVCGRRVRSPPTMSQKGRVICVRVLAGPAIAGYVKLAGDRAANGITDWTVQFVHVCLADAQNSFELSLCQPPNKYSSQSTTSSPAT